MNPRDKQAVDNAKRKTKQPTPPQAAQQAGGGMSDTLMQMSVELKEAMKGVVVPTAVMLLMQDFAAGDYGEMTPEIFGQLSGGMIAPLEAQRQALLEGRVLTAQPALLPVSSGEQITSSSSTC